MKKLSVIVPVYNAQEWISETLESLIKQTYKEIEIVCVDDGSTDGSRSIIEDYQNKFKKVKLIQQQNAGVSAARNKGIDYATGDYIAFLDADDYIDEQAYEMMISRMESENSDICFCEFVRFWPNGKVLYVIEENFINLINNPRDIKYFLYSTKSRVDNNTLFTKDIHGACWRSIFKKSIINKSSIKFHTDLRFAEDQIFMLEYLFKVKKISYLKNAFVHYRGWTKKWRYVDNYNNHISLLNYQIAEINKREYLKRNKKRLIGYCKCTTFFIIINEVFKFKTDAHKIVKIYCKNKNFNKLLTTYNFIQKFKVKPSFKKILLFILLKLRMFKTIKIMYPNKKY